MFAGFNADPENPGRPGRGEEAGISETQVDRRTLHRTQSGLDLIQLLRLAQKLQCDMKRLRSDPARAGCDRPHLGAELRYPLAYSGIDIESNEEAHGFTSEGGAPC